MNKPKIKIAYIGGGSRNWARVLMNDLAKEDAFCARVALYDIDRAAAEKNVLVGEKFTALKDAKGKHTYFAAGDYKEALTGADFVIISVLPGTLREMHSDVHTPEKYGIYQSVGDTAGPGGIIRALRAVPIFREFAEKIRELCPNAWVINYTNPMTLCVRTLYEVFPEIKAFGCCHEVFGTQELIAAAYREKTGESISRSDVHISVAGVNHFTWITEAKYKNHNLLEIYRDFVNKYAKSGYQLGERNWLNSHFACMHRVKFDLFRRFGAIAAAGDRHLAEFCPGDWYLKNPETVREWCFGLTPVDWRIEDRARKIQATEDILSGSLEVSLTETGEEGVQLIKAILGLTERVTNCNLKNVGQMPGAPLGAVVETNAHFSADSVKPIVANPLPSGAMALVSRVIAEQEILVRAILSGDFMRVYECFANDPLVRLDTRSSWQLYLEMIENTKEYIPGAAEFLELHK